MLALWGATAPVRAAPAPEVEPAVAGPAPAVEGPPPDDAPAEERADYWFRRGNWLGEQGDFLGAARAWERSVALVPTPEGLLNRAIAYEWAHLPLEAIAAYEDYLEQLGARAPDIDLVRDAIRRLDATVGTIQVRFDRKDAARILVDGVRRTAGDFPLRVLPGVHEVVVQESDGQRRAQRYELGPGQVWTLDFTQRAGPATVPEFRPPPSFDVEAARRREVIRSLFWANVGLTSGAGVALATFGGLTLHERDEVRRAACGTAPECEQAGNPAYPEEHARRFEAFRSTTNALVGVTAGLATVALALGIVAHAAREPDPDRAPRRVAPAPGGVHIRF